MIVASAALPPFSMPQAPAGHPSDVPARLLRMCDLAAAAYDS